MKEIYKNENIHVKDSKIIIQQEESYAKASKRINRCSQHVNIANEHNSQICIIKKKKILQHAVIQNKYMQT